MPLYFLTRLILLFPSPHPSAWLISSAGPLRGNQLESWFCSGQHISRQPRFVYSAALHDDADWPETLHLISSLAQPSFSVVPLLLSHFFSFSLLVKLNTDGTFCLWNNFTTLIAIHAGAGARGPKLSMCSRNTCGFDFLLGPVWTN